ncbi:Uncharacterised protein [Bacillus freudenreichii]|nr:Uncharacterised protein [Bacillus freudenreichii]
MIIHYLSLCPKEADRFSEIRRDLPQISPSALSTRLPELASLVDGTTGANTPSLIVEKLLEARKLLFSKEIEEMYDVNQEDIKSFVEVSLLLIRTNWKSFSANFILKEYKTGISPVFFQYWRRFCGQYH